MQDRSVEFPGRRKMTDAVTGDVYYFDVELAEGEITESGTPYDTASVLTDETAEALGLTSDATPNDAFSTIATKLNALVDADERSY